MTLSLIITNRENPSGLRRPRRSAILLQKSFERVLESTSKACGRSRGVNRQHCVGVVCVVGVAYLVGLIWEENFVEDLSGLILNGIHFHQVRRVAAGTSAGEGGRDRT